MGDDNIISLDSRRKKAPTEPEAETTAGCVRIIPLTGGAVQLVIEDEEGDLSVELSDHEAGRLIMFLARAVDASRKKT